VARREDGLTRCGQSRRCRHRRPRTRPGRGWRARSAGTTAREGRRPAPLQAAELLELAVAAALPGWPAWGQAGVVTGGLAAVIVVLEVPAPVPVPGALDYLPLHRRGGSSTSASCTWPGPVRPWGGSAPPQVWDLSGILSTQIWLVRNGKRPAELGSPQPCTSARGPYVLFGHIRRLIYRSA
jgi:hypothetical protein